MSKFITNPCRICGVWSGEYRENVFPQQSGVRIGLYICAHCWDTGARSWLPTAVVVAPEHEEEG